MPGRRENDPAKASPDCRTSTFPAPEFKCGNEHRLLRRPYSFSFGRGASFRSHGRAPLASRSQARSVGPFSNSALYLARSVLIWSRIEGGASLEAGAACPWVDRRTIAKAAKKGFFIEQVNQLPIAQSIQTCRSGQTDINERGRPRRRLAVNRAAERG